MKELIGKIQNFYSWISTRELKKTYFKLKFYFGKWLNIRSKQENVKYNFAIRVPTSNTCIGSNTRY